MTRASLPLRIAAAIANPMLAGCLQEIDPPAEVDAELTFDEDVWPILESNCSCHEVGDSAPGGLSMLEDTAYDNLVDAEAVLDGTRDYLRVEPGQPNRSWLWWMVTGTSGLQMPLGEEPGLSGSQLATIRDWIFQGAVER
jgi:hypothetical protein